MRIRGGNRQHASKIVINANLFTYHRLEISINNLQMNHEIELGKLRNQIHDKTAAFEDLTSELERLREKLELKATQEEHKGRENS